MRFAAIVEYDGSGYHGWQRQSHAVSVQARIETALSKVANDPIVTVCAGRTDTGVHATGQVISFETPAQRDRRAWLLGTNSNLPADISLRWVGQIDPSFHARFSARSRRYRYVILNRNARSALLGRRVYCLYPPLDHQLMDNAAQHLRGEHDFSSFRSGACQAHHPVRRIHSIAVSREGDLVYLDLQANGFLHNMVRIIAGVLIAVGRGETTAERPLELLHLKDRRASGMTAPACGLYFVGAQYPAHFGMPDEDWYPRF